jgi:two-component system cell cycle sensor histidine kinase/response regulator CckA
MGGPVPDRSMQAKLRLKPNDRKFRLLFEENPLAMWVFDSETSQILEANAAAVDLYGYSAEEFRGMPLAKIQGDDDARRFTQELTAELRPAAAAWRHHNKNGQALDVEVGVHQIDYGGRQVAMAVLIDITGRLRLEEQLRQAQKMEAVGMLAGGVAHDFNNLLTIIGGYSQLMLNSLAPNDPNRHSLEQVIKAGERAAALTQQLLAFSRRQVLQPKVLDLNKLVSSLSTMLRRLIGEDIDLRLELGADLGRVNADPGQLEQVLMNLAVNARDAMPKGGTLTLETANVVLDETYAMKRITVKPGPYVLVAVSDNGSGMDEATQSRLFEPFFTTKATGKGTGLGLSTVFGIVKQSGGSLGVYSEPGRGTSVKVYLPRIDQPVSIEATGTPKTIRPGTESILLVEDDDMVRNLVRETLERHGYRIKDAATPADAIRISEAHSGKLHLLITDVIMPQVSGTELALQLKESRPDMKVLYISGYTDNAIVNSGLLQKEVAFLQKPFTPGSLLEKVHEVLENNGKKRMAGE